jgi:hypothetical protein
VAFDRDPTEPLALRRRHLETRAGMLLLVGVVAMSVICAGIIVSGWFAGVMWDPAERVFWTGAICGWLMIVVLALANIPGGPNDARAISVTTWLLRVGMILLIASPTLCLAALVADFSH